MPIITGPGATFTKSCLTRFQQLVILSDGSSIYVPRFLGRSIPRVVLQRRDAITQPVKNLRYIKREKKDPFRGRRRK